MSVADRIDPPHDPALAAVRVCRVSDSHSAVEPDVLAVEEPLEIRLACRVGERIHAGRVRCGVPPEASGGRIPLSVVYT